MDTKLSLYDFLAYIVPGAVLTILLYWFSVACLTLPSFVHVSIPDAVSFLLFIVVSYFLGHVVQSQGARRQKKREVENGWSSEKFLQDGDKRYTKEYKRGLKECIEFLYDLKPDPDSLSDPEAQKHRQQEMFYFCSAVVRQELSTSNADIFQSVCALYRSLHIVVFIGIWLGGLTTLKYCLLYLFSWFIPVKIPHYDLFTLNPEQLFLGAALAIFFFWSRFRLKSRWDQYTDYYVDSVYTNFYAWYCLKHKKSPADGQTQPQKSPANSQTQP